MKPGAKALEALSRVATPSRGLDFTMTLYPPRAAEAFSSWMILLWGIAVVRSGDMMSGPHFTPMLRYLSEDHWGWTAIIAAALSLAALVWNGHGKPTPALRLIGALYRCSFWIILSCAFYVSVLDGARDFPMRSALLVPIMFEIYASIWIGRDIMIHATKMPSRVPARSASVRAGNG